MSKLEPEFFKCELVRVADSELELLASFSLIALRYLCLGFTFAMFTSLYFFAMLNLINRALKEARRLFQSLGPFGALTSTKLKLVTHPRELKNKFLAMA